MVLTDEEILKLLKYGLWIKLKEAEDKKLTHYYVLDFSYDELLICFGGIDWRTGETGYTPHVIKQSDKDKKWFFEPKKKIVKRDNLKTKPVTEFPILETLSNVNTRNSGYVKADVTRDGEVIFSSTNNAKEACTAKEINQLLK